VLPLVQEMVHDAAIEEKGMLFRELCVPSQGAFEVRANDRGAAVKMGRPPIPERPFLCAALTCRRRWDLLL
jgi:hypothetical protein